MIFTEVNLFASDMVMASVALLGYFKLNPQRESIGNYYKLFLLYTGCAAVVAGFGHLLSYHTGNNLKALGWCFAIVANTSIGLACLQLTQKEPLRIILFAKAVVVGIIVLYTQQFRWVTFDTIFTMIILVIPTHLFGNGNKQTGGWIVGSIAFTMLTGMISFFDISFSDEWLTPKDINHLIIAIGLWMIYIGAKKLE
ncbi:MAG: hypothetical protein MUE96_11615 [Bacteroidia bacterium]|jgi:hypothetical protein|nr:hypothetical protein [Bacteroidia bacterium]